MRFYGPLQLVPIVGKDIMYTFGSSKLHPHIVVDLMRQFLDRVWGRQTGLHF